MASSVKKAKEKALEIGKEPFDIEGLRKYWVSLYEKHFSNEINDKEIAQQNR
ncbi:hypothetical protein HCH_00470 [Hahella chejuensis KCTC 2396]|uniref:Uncharacterized protein n=1 Tax=Hahella chejuensis (strain KCTC 2396) TaxID=349521 RepID=Q2SPP4_HAHCH|nr:hypothetical protein HCH_00470 [Hahella chejuensis KCTC 2396]